MLRRAPAHRYQRVVEFASFLVIGLLVALRAVYFMVRFPGQLMEVLAGEYLSLLLAVLVITFPWLYRLVFAVTPLEHIQVVRARRIAQAAARAEAADAAQPPVAVAADSADSAEIPHEIGKTRIESLLKSYVESSRDIAGGLYTRAGVYLILGAVIAFSGLFFFYSQTTRKPTQSPTGRVPAAASTAKDRTSELPNNEDAVGVLAERVADLAPRFGILFFIEIVAFFFLRQYRSAMEEFRYFEAVKRHREEALALICLMADAGGAIDVPKLLEKGILFSSVAGTPPSAATGVLETGKLSKEELTLLEKVVSAIGAARPAG